MLRDDFLNEMLAVFPKNYNFEIHKCVWRLQELKAELGKERLTVVLQLPQGLQMFACLLADVFGNYTGSEVLIIADENYGACCIEDVQASILGADFIIHYGGLTRSQLSRADPRDAGQGHVRVRGHHVRRGPPGGHRVPELPAQDPAVSQPASTS